MRSIIGAGLLAASVMAVFGSVSSAAASDYAYCLQGRQWGYPGNCQFVSYNQCMATASGTFASCGINPRVAFQQQRLSDR